MGVVPSSKRKMSFYTQLQERGRDPASHHVLLTGSAPEVEGADGLYPLLDLPPSLR